MEEAPGSARRAAQPFSYAGFLSPMTITEPLLARVAQFFEPRTAETPGFLSQAEPLEKARFSEQQMVEVPGSVRQTEGEYFFSMFRSLMQTMELLLAIKAPLSERLMAVTPGHLKSAERRKRSTGFRSPIRTRGLLWVTRTPTA